MGLSSYNGFPGAQREAVQRWLNTQWDAGRLPRPSKCVACGQTEGAIDGHLENYDEPTSYVDLCVTCHMLLHMRFRNRMAWTLYRDRVRGGWQAPPLTRCQPIFAILQRGIIAENWPDGTWTGRGVSMAGEPEPTYLDTLPLTRDQQLHLL